MPKLTFFHLPVILNIVIVSQSVVRPGTWLENPFSVLQPFLLFTGISKKEKAPQGCLFAQCDSIFFFLFTVSPIRRKIEHRRIEGICRLQRSVVAEIIGCLADALAQGKS